MAETTKQLVKIEHNRCGEWRADTYVWATAEMSEGELHKLIDSAKVSYLKAEEDFKDAKAPRNPGWSPNYANYPPNLTLGEAKAQWEKEKAAYGAWEAKQKAARQTFAQHLIALGNGMITGFYDHPELLSVTVSWGHRHGQTIEYGETEPWKKDLNAAKDEDDDVEGDSNG